MSKSMSMLNLAIINCSHHENANVGKCKRALKQFRLCEKAIPFVLNLKFIFLELAQMFCSLHMGNVKFKKFKCLHQVASLVLWITR